MLPPGLFRALQLQTLSVSLIKKWTWDSFPLSLGAFLVSSLLVLLLQWVETSPALFSCEESVNVPLAGICSRVCFALLLFMWLLTSLVCCWDCKCEIVSGSFPVFHPRVRFNQLFVCLCELLLSINSFVVCLTTWFTAAPRAVALSAGNWEHQHLEKYSPFPVPTKVIFINTNIAELLMDSPAEPPLNADMGFDKHSNVVVFF